MLQRLRNLFPFRHSAMLYEITPRCNLRCAQCYNVWKDYAGYSNAELSPSDALALTEKILRESHCSNFTITGGEPCLRKDLEDIVRLAAHHCQQVTLITNGTLLTPERITALIAAGVTLFELPLNAGSAELHNRLAWGNLPIAPASPASPEKQPCSACAEPFSAFARVTEAAAEIALQGGSLAFVFVATRHNIGDWEEALKLGIALGARGFLFNRYNAGGECHQQPQELMPSVKELQAGLEIANRYAAEYKIGIGASIAMPPCLIRHEDYPNVGFGFCAAGTSRAYYTVSPLGDVRPCNHSPTILGNLRTQQLREIIAPKNMREFMTACPEFCQDCRLAKTCQGGCKAAAEACYGDLHILEPFIQLNRAAANSGKESLANV